jgi:hypothetical protein
MGLAKPLKLRLFLEGQEVPVVSANVQANIFAPASAAIQIVPVDSALRFKPRTMVHLFFLEESAAKFSAEMVEGESVVTASRDDIPHDGPLADQAYKLLFAGEVVGFSFVKQPMSRGFVLQCLDFSSYWDSLHVFMLDYSSDQAFSGKAVYYGADDTLISSIPSTQAESRVAQWVRGRPITPGLSSINGLAGGIIHMMEVMSGVPGKRLGVNDFFTLSELRCHLLAQVSAEENDSTSQNLLDVSVFYRWIFNEIQSGGGTATLRDMMKMMCSFISYQVVPNPVAKFDPAGKKVWSMVEPEGYQSYASRPAVAKMQLTAQDVNQSVQANPLPQDVVTAALASLKTGVSPGIPSVPSKSRVKIERFVTALTASLNRFKTFESLSVDPETVAAVQKEIKNDASILTNAIFAVAGGGEKIEARWDDVEAPQRLRTQFFRPDTYMVAPPVCNVIFPEMYSSMNYDRTFLAETTRMLIQFNNVLDKKASPITGTFILQPDPGTKTKNLMKNIKVTQYGLLMDHEYHTGIILKEANLPDGMGISVGATSDEQKILGKASKTWAQRVTLHYFFKNRIGPRSMSVGGRFMPYLVAGFPALVIQKPWIWEDSGELSEEEQLDLIFSNTRSKTAPSQFIGQVEALTHTVGQDGAHSSISMSHCRPHAGIDDEYIETLISKATLEGKKGELTQRIRYRLDLDKVKDDVKWLSVLQKCGPQPLKTEAPKGSTVTKKKGEKQVEDTQKSAGPSAPPFTVFRVVGTVDEVEMIRETGTPNAASVPASFVNERKKVLVPSPAGEVKNGSDGFFGGTIVGVEVGNDGRIETVKTALSMSKGEVTAFSSVILYEDVPISGEYDIPIEDLVRPVWMPASYDNSMIGKSIYYPFLGCQSIVDQLVTTKAGQEASSVLATPVSRDGLDVEPGDGQARITEQIKEYVNAKTILSIEKAVNAIAYLYGKVKSDERADVDEFVTSFCRRPIATMADILGSHDLELKITGTKVEATKGTIGFHTLSVNEQVVMAGGLTGLVLDPTSPLAYTDKNAKRTIAEAYDVRAAKLSKVKEYLAELASKDGGGLMG